MNFSNYSTIKQAWPFFAASLIEFPSLAGPAKICALKSMLKESYKATQNIMGLKFLKKLDKYHTRYQNIQCSCSMCVCIQQEDI